MSKYYKAEDVIDKVTEYISSDYPTEERAREDVELLFADTPTIEVNEDKEIELGTMLNGSYKLGFEHGRESVVYSEDAISREYLLSKVYDMDNDNLVVDLKDIETAPSVVSSRAEGEWVVRANGNNECSICGREKQDGWVNFCGFCGANMKG